MIKVSILLSLVMLTFSTVPKITVYVESLCPGCNQLESTVISDFTISQITVNLEN